jgi:predicted HD superfamily hydrolase involved in NAD metabolism
VPDAEKKLRRELDALPDGLHAHVLRALETGLWLAARHNVDVAKVRLAVLGHDLLRATPREELLRLATEQGLEPNEAERHEPLLLHGPATAAVLRDRFGIDDPDILNAVRYHTTARAGMSDVEKVVFLADKIEPEELSYYPEWREVRDLAETDLDAAMLRALDLYVARARREGWMLHPDVLAARAYYASSEKSPR